MDDCFTGSVFVNCDFFTSVLFERVILCGVTRFVSIKSCGLSRNSTGVNLALFVGEIAE